LKTTIKFIFLILTALILEMIFQIPGWIMKSCPHFLFALILFTGIRWKENAGAIIGFIIGLIYSSIYSEPAGLSPLVYTLIGYGSGKLSPYVRETPSIVIFFFTAIMYLNGEILSSLLASLFQAHMISVRILALFSTSLLFALIYAPLESLFSKKTRYQSW
jgi:rod shape-determining protein MreD